MLIGQYCHNIDVKGRLNFPSKLRDNLGDRFIITRGLDNCLNVYSLAEWELLSESIKTLPRSKRRELERFFFSGASEALPDKQGRINIPLNLREYAGITKDVMIVGASDHAEIWDKQTWEKVYSQLSADSVAQIMDELGF